MLVIKERFQANCEGLHHRQRLDRHVALHAGVRRPRLHRRMEHGAVRARCTNQHDLRRHQHDSVTGFARPQSAGEQWRDIEEHKALVIFSEPHAYISPKHYEKELNVPTWNYISIHTYGKGTLITETEDVIALLENTIDNYDSAYKEQWNKLPNDYKIGMSKGIVAFDIVVTDLQAKKKLSQNKTANEQLNIINELSNSTDSNERLVADYMKQQQNV